MLYHYQRDSHMHILFLTDNFPPECNAPATRTHEHAMRWVEAGHQVTIVTGAPNFPQGKVYEGYQNRWYHSSQEFGMTVVRVKTYIAANEGFLPRILDYISFMIAGALAACFQRKPDVVIATSPQFFCALAGWFTATVRRKPFVLEIRDLWPASIVAVGAMRPGLFIRLMEKLELMMYRHATRIVVVTRAFKRDMVQRGIKADKISVVFNGVDPRLFRPMEKSATLLDRHQLEGRFVVGYIGTMGLAHDLGNVLKAARQLIPEEQIGFLFVGAGAEADNVRHTIQNDGVSNARFVAQCPREEIPALLNLCDLCIVPLRNTDVFRTVIPSKLFECMAAGVPVIMSIPEGEATAIVESTGCGLVVAPEDPAALAAAIERLRAEPQLLQQMKDNCIKAAALYSRDQLALDMFTVIEQATSGTSTTPASQCP